MTLGGLLMNFGGGMVCSEILGWLVGVRGVGEMMISDLGGE